MGLADFDAEHRPQDRMVDGAAYLGCGDPGPQHDRLVEPVKGEVGDLGQLRGDLASVPDGVEQFEDGLHGRIIGHHRILSVCPICVGIVGGLP